MIQCCIHIDIDKIYLKRLQNDIYHRSMFCRTEWNIVINFGIHIDIDKIYLKRLQNDIYHWSRVCLASNSEKSENGPIS